MTSRLIYGFHAVISKLRHDPESIKEILIDATRQDARARDLLKHAELQGTRVIATDGKRLDGMAPDGKHQGVVARIEGGRKVAHLDDVLDTLEEPAFLLVLDGITDPRNLGACLRVADAAGVHAVIAPKDRAEWPKATAWVLGAEGEGMRRLTRENCDQLVKIPMHGTVESLNVSVAAGVCLFEARRRLS